MANPLIVSELQAPAIWGLNSVQRTYNNPGGAPRNDNIAAIEANAALLNQQDVDVYREDIQPYEFFKALTAAGLQGLSQQERADYEAFIVPMLGNGPVDTPDGLLRDLVRNVVFSNGQDAALIQANYEALITTQRSIASVMGVNASAGEVEQAMYELGWIV